MELLYRRMGLESRGPTVLFLGGRGFLRAARLSTPPTLAPKGTIAVASRATAR